MPSLAASRRSSVTVIAPAPEPVPFDAPRLRAAAFAPSRPRAVRVFFGSLAMDFCRRAPVCAFFTFLRAACRCFCVAIVRSAYPGSARATRRPALHRHTRGGPLAVRVAQAEHHDPRAHPARHALQDEPAPLRARDPDETPAVREPEVDRVAEAGRPRPPA